MAVGAISAPPSAPGDGSGGHGIRLNTNDPPECPRQESNLDLPLRRRSSYPLDYEGSARWTGPELRLPARVRRPGRKPSELGAKHTSRPAVASTEGPKLAAEMNGVSTLLRLASRIACAIVVVSFALFAIDQAGSASAQQQNVVNESAPAGTAAISKPKSTKTKSEGGVRDAIDEASSAITSPFDGAVAGVHNEWAHRGALLVLALLLYGFALGYLARVLRVRV